MAGKEKKDEKKAFVEEEEVPTLTQEMLSQLWEKKRLCDVTFLIGDQKLPAHRVVLAAASPIFEGMLYNRRADGSSDSALPKGPFQVKIKDTDPATFQAMLHCIYTDELQVDTTNIHNLVKAASKYQVEKLRNACADFMEQDVNKDNVIDLFQIAPTLFGDEEFGLKFIEDNTEEVLKGDGVLRLSKERFIVILKSSKLSIREIDLFKAVQRWGEAQLIKVMDDDKEVTLASVTKDLVPHIRFPLMELNDIATIVSTSNILEASQLVSLFSYVSVTDPEVRALLPDPGFITEERTGEIVSGSSNWTWDTKKKGRNVDLSNNNLTISTRGYSWQYGLALGTKEFKSGNHYWEIRIDYSNSDMVGVCSPTIPYDYPNIYSTYPTQCWFLHHNSGLYGGSVGTKSYLDLGARTGDTIGFHLVWNRSNSTFDMQVYKNKVMMGTPFRGIPPPVVAAVELYSTPARCTLDPKAKLKV